MVTACISAFLFESFIYNVVFLGRVLPGAGRAYMVPAFIVPFNLLWAMGIWSYLKVAWANPGVVPDSWHQFVNKVGILLPVTRGQREWQPGKATMCEKCNRPRPERAHHCGVCGICIMRMDHHCPWINNCVGFRNHKYFLLACGYVLLACGVGFGTAATELAKVTFRAQYIVHGVKSSDLELIDEVAFLLSVALALCILSLVSPLLFMQLRLVLSNRTAVESNYNNMPNPYETGSALGNLAQLFGRCGVDWLVPIAPWRPLLDGVSFPSVDERFPMLGTYMGPPSGPNSPQSRSPHSPHSPHSPQAAFATQRNMRPGNPRLPFANAMALPQEDRWYMHYNIIEPPPPHNRQQVPGCL